MYRLLDFYRCYRAYVRGKVMSIRLQASPPPSCAPAGASRGVLLYARGALCGAPHVSSVDTADGAYRQGKSTGGWHCCALI
jgi:hypothetical protein